MPEQQTISQGGLARDDNGDLAHHVSHELLSVVTLLYAGINDMGDADHEGITDQSSRRTTLMHLADAKVRDVLKVIEPYV